MNDPTFSKFDPSFPKNYLLHEVSLIHGDLINENLKIIAEDEGVAKTVVRNRLQQRRKEIEKELGYKTNQKQMLDWFLSKCSYEDGCDHRKALSTEKYRVPSTTFLDYY